MLEERDLDVLSAMMTIFLHAAEQCVSMVELHYTNQNRKSQEYKQLVKARGKAYAEQVLGKLVRDCFRHDKKWDFNELMRLGTAFKRQMDRLTDVSVHKTVSKDATEEEKTEAAMATMRMFDDQRHDVAQLLYVASMMFNLDERQRSSISARSRCSPRTAPSSTNHSLTDSRRDYDDKR